MPDLTGERLDVAYQALNEAGFTKKSSVKIVGGGALGVVVESNWTVCSQAPVPGSPLSDAPTLTIARDCTTDDEPSLAPTPEPRITIKNNPEFEKLMRSVQNDATEAAFAKKYAGRLIEFDGNIAKMTQHGGYTTRYDMLILAGNYPNNHAIGPYLRFINVSPVNDLHPTRTGGPDTIGEGDNIHVIARLDEFDPNAGSCQIEPVHVDHR